MAECQETGMTRYHVLITRPQPEAAELASSLADAGMSPVLMPAYGFEATPPGPSLEAFCRSPGRKLIIFTSKRAVAYGLPGLSADLLQAADVAAIGPATAAALESAGCAVSVVPEGGYTSEDLLQHPGLLSRPGTALILAAPGGRTALAEGLERAGWRASMAFVYRRVELEPAAAEVQRLLLADNVVSVWTSENAMRSLAVRLPGAAWKKVCQGTAVVTSERLRKALQALGARHVVVAAGPGNSHLKARLLHLT